MLPWGKSSRRPGGAAPTREGTPAPIPAPFAQVVQRGPAACVLFTLTTFKTGAFRGAEGAGHSHSTATKAQGGRLTTPAPAATTAARPSNKTPLVLSPRLALSVLLLLRKTCAYPHPRHEVSYLGYYVKRAFACFGNSSISHTPNVLPARSRGVYPKK